MNNRIRELIEDSGAIPINGDLKNRALVGFDKIEKFAELIIQECLGLCKDAENAFQMHGMQEREAHGAISVQEYIKEHFGVEE